MPDKRLHRGSHPEDATAFSTAQIEPLRQALHDFSLLLTKGYAPQSSLKLVGDRFGLTQRQRMAVMRASCSDIQLSRRREHEIPAVMLTGTDIAIDGYNLLITIESALSGAFLFRGIDGCLRDLASIHGTYRRVDETIPAIKLAAKCIAELGIRKTTWLFDSPVSNSGRLKTLIRTLAADNNWPWEIKLLQAPDKALAATAQIVVSSDSNVLDRCDRWSNLAKYIIEEKIPSASIIDLICD